MKNLIKLNNISDLEQYKDNDFYPRVIKSFNEDDESSVNYSLITVEKLVKWGYLEYDKTNGIFKTLKKIPYMLSNVIDFKKFFIDDFKYNDLNSIFLLSDTLHLDEDAQIDLINIYSTFYFNRPFARILVRNINLPNNNISIYKKIVNKEDSSLDDFYDLSHDMFRGSNFNTVTLRVRDKGISSMLDIFRGALFETLILKTDTNSDFEFNEMGGAFEFNSKLKNLPNNINWSKSPHMPYAFENCSSLVEIPSHYKVTNEEERLTIIENIIGGEKNYDFNGTQYLYNIDQTFNGCLSLVKIGPVINMKNIFTNPHLCFNGCSKLKDVRLKNVNCDLNISSLVSLDSESIKYCIKNLTDLHNEYYDDFYWYNEKYNISTRKIEEDSKTLSWVYGVGGNVYSQYKITIPEGLTAKIYYRVDNNNNISDNFNTIVGNGTENTVNNVSCYRLRIELTKNDGSDFNVNDLKNYSKLKLLILDNDGITWNQNNITNISKTITFSDDLITLMTNKEIISSEDIIEANNKGWTIFCNDIEITPELENVTVKYKFSFNDWELNEKYSNNDIIVEDYKLTIKKFRPNDWIIRSSESLNSTDLSTKFCNTTVTIEGNDDKSYMYTSNFHCNGAVGGDGGTKGSIRGVGILPYSLHSTPQTYYAPELPFSSYAWDSVTKNDGTSVQLGSELSAWRADFNGAGYNSYGFMYDKVRKKVYPDIKTFPTPYNNYKLAIGVYMGSIHTFDRWWADNTTLKSYLDFKTPFKVTMCGRREVNSTLTSKMLATQECFNNVKFKFSGLLENDYIIWSHNNSTIVDSNGNTITAITEDGEYLISNSGVDGGFILYGDNTLTCTNPITIEILDNPSFIDSDGYIDISDKPITIKLIKDAVLIE